MNRWKAFVPALVVLIALGIVYGMIVIGHGFSATAQPSAVEMVMARTVRNLGIPRSARNKTNPLSTTSVVLQEARDSFTDRCAGCHGKDGDGRTGIGPNLYPKAPDLGRPETQNLSDGEIHYIIQNGVRLTGMPALGNPHGEQDDTTAWKLVIFVRSIGRAIPLENTQQAPAALLVALRWIGRVRKMPQRDLRALEENAHGERGSRSTRTSRCDHPRSRHQ